MASSKNNAHNFLPYLQLLVKDPRKRLGGGPDDSASVKGHAFFRSIHWDDLLRKVCLGGAI